MTHGSLFSGIGGFDLAAEWMGWENKFHCEWEDFPRKVLKYYWTNATSYGDIKQTDFTIWRGRIDILTGGFPCQPYSTAGKRLGKEDDRHLWPEMLRAIREIAPRWVVGENVRGLLSWNGGLVFDEVQADLEAEGYEVLPFILPACGVNAPHRRDRIWFVAHANDTGGYKSEINTTETRKSAQHGSDGCNQIGPTPNADNQRQEWWMHEARPEKAERHVGSHDSRRYRRLTWQDFPTKPPICGGNDGIPRELDGEALYPHSPSRRTKGGAFGKWRSESIKAYGNAIVPQVVYQIFKSIERYKQATR